MTKSKKTSLLFLSESNRGQGFVRKQAWSLNNGGLWKKAERKNEESKENFYSSLLNNST